jgi:hypothetical protein
MAKELVAEKALLSEGPDALTRVECVMLNQLLYHPGFKVLAKIEDAAITRATQAMMKVHQENPDYDRLVGVRALAARITNETIKLIRDSVLVHTGSIAKMEEQENTEADERVERMTGIHPAVPKAKPDDAIAKTFGIHLAKPKKKKEEK